VDVTSTRLVSEQVASGRLDVGICSAPPPGLDLEFEPLFAEDLTLLVPIDHALAAEDVVSKEDIASHRLIVTEEGCAYRRAIDAGLCASGTALGSVMEITSVLALGHSVQAGLGIALLPESSATPPPAGTVKKRIDDISFCVRVGIVTRSAGPRPSPTVRAFVEHLRAGLSEDVPAA
jgi:DNA-binding transcriptional LysR family regulator